MPTIYLCANTDCLVPYLVDKTAPLANLCLACREEMFTRMINGMIAFEDLPDDTPSNA